MSMFRAIMAIICGIAIGGACIIGVAALISIDISYVCNNWDINNFDQMVLNILSIMGTVAAVIFLNIGAFAAFTLPTICAIDY